MRFQCRIGSNCAAPAGVAPELPRVDAAFTAPRRRERRRAVSSLNAVVAGGAVLFALGGCAAPDGRPGWAIAPLVQITHGTGPAGRAHYELGRRHDAAGAWEPAIEAYRRAIAADAADIEAYNALGVALARNGQLEQAETTLRQAVALAPERAHLRSNLGLVLLRAGRSSQALEELRAAARDGDAMATAQLRTAEPRVAVAALAPAPQAAVPAETPAATPAPVAATIELPLPVTTVELPLPRAGTIEVAAPPLVAAHALPLRLEISNGNGMRGMAADIGRRLAQQGMPVGRLTNQRPFRQQRTTVQYREGFESAARAVARSMTNAAAVDLQPTAGLRSDVRVVLGHDWRAPAAVQVAAADR